MTRGRVWIPRPDAPQIAQRLRERRRSTGLTQAELAARADLAHSTFVHWEKGRLPDTLATATVNALEAALRVPPGWLMSHEAPPLPDPAVLMDDAAACTQAGPGGLPERIPAACCEAVGPPAARLRAELGLSVAEVARACGVSRPTLLQWERGAFPKALTGRQLCAWARALRLVPGQLLALPASHPRAHDGSAT
ncbi:helix-turn-helix domain-containing protein [Paraburkholderia oxyphila]|uniref:helix-turn-helix domain-containing protein n=1 Tax=Paraburkholderia oxyphila TaxID=614212 RepID=UPI000484E719|nr:helix-turn-helix transcriptional regulator [Paraburkholderia oxyphila]